LSQSKRHKHRSHSSAWFKKATYRQEICCANILQFIHIKILFLDK
jgi:hypothetical protein